MERRPRRTLKAHRGSKRRINRITLRGNWSIEVWMLAGVVLIALLVIVPWLVEHHG